MIYDGFRVYGLIHVLSEQWRCETHISSYAWGEYTTLQDMAVLLGFFIDGWVMTCTSIRNRIELYE